MNWRIFFFTGLIMVLGSLASATPSVLNGWVNSTSSMATISLGGVPLFWYANYTGNGVTEGNSTFKVFERSLYQPQNRSLIGYWKLDGNGNDSSSYGNAGTFKGNVRSNSSQNCMIDDCLTFPANTDYVNVPITPGSLLNLTTAYTAEVWVYGLDPNREAHVFNFGGKAGANRNVFMRLDPVGEARKMSCFMNNATGTIEPRASVTFINNSWTHYACVYDGSTLKIYQNGVMSNSVNRVGLIMPQNTSMPNMSISSEQGGGSVGFPGNIDELAIYNYAKNAAEVYNDYKNSPYSALIYKDAIAYWHLDENGGTNGYADSSGNGNTLIPVAGTSFIQNTTGIVGGGVNFTGKISYLQLANSATLRSMKNFSWGGWQNPGDPISTTVRWMDKGVFGPPSDGFFIEYVGTTNQNVNNCRVANGSVAPITAATTTKAARNTWSHVMCTFNGTHINAYLNGNLEATTAFVGVPNLTNTDFGIGGDGNQGATFNGTVDEIVVYNHTLTSSEVIQLYQRTLYGVSPQVLFIQPNNLTGLNTSDNEAPTTVSGASLQPGYYVTNLTLINNTRFFHFDENGGSNYTDAGGMGVVQKGAITNVTGAIRGGIKFDGLTGLLNLSAQPFNQYSNFSFGGWVKYDTLGNGAIYSSTFNTNKDCYYLGLNPSRGNFTTSNTLKFLIAYNGIGDALQPVVDSGFTPTIGEWNHVMVTFNYDAQHGNDQIYIYINGQLKKSIGIPGGAGSACGTNFQYFGFETETTNFFNGSIDEFATYNVTLAASAIQAEYSKVATGLGLLSNSYINYSAAGNFNEREGTVEFWVKPNWNATDGIQHTFVSAESVNNNDFVFYKNTLNNLVVWIQSINTNIVNKDVSGWRAGDWHHVVFTYNNYTSATTLSIDGSQVASAATSFMIPSQSWVIIGSENSGTLNFCNCTISDFRISRKALTSQEINLTYSKGRPLLQNEYMINGSNYVKNNALKVQYSPSDNTGTAGTAVNSSAVTISNSPPPKPFFKIPLINGSNQNFTNINFTSASDDDSDVITYYLYDNKTGFNQSSIGNITLPVGIEGVFNFNLSSFDGTEWSVNTTIYNITVDTVQPILTVVSNTPANDSFLPRSDYFVNITVTDGTDISALIDFNNTLVGWWRMEEGSGTTLKDTSSYSTPMTWNSNSNVTYTTTGVRGSALNLSLRTQGSSVPSTGFSQSYNFTGTQGYSIETWVNMKTNIGGVQRFITISGGTYDFTSCRYGGSSNGVQFYNFNTTGGNPVLNSKFIPDTNKWYHVACVYNGTALLAYVNGNLTGTTPTKGPVSDSRQVAFAAGDEACNCTFDEVKVWKRAISWSEVNASYNNGLYRLERNFTGLSDGNYTWKAYAVDKGGNIQTSGIQNVMIDTTDLITPTLGWVNPQSNNLTWSKQPLNLNVSCNDFNLWRCNLTVYAPNNTIIYTNYTQGMNVTNYSINVTLTLPVDGNYTIQLGAADRVSHSPEIPQLKFNKAKQEELNFWDNQTSFNVTLEIWNPSPNNNSKSLIPYNIRSGTTFDGKHYKTNYTLNEPSGTERIALKLTSNNLIFFQEVNKDRLKGHFIIGDYYYTADDISKDNDVDHYFDGVNHWVIVKNSEWDGNGILNLDPIVGGLNRIQEDTLLQFDQTIPRIDWGTMTYNSSNSTFSNGWLYLNFTYNESNNASYIIRINDTQYSNVKVDGSGTFFTLNYTATSLASLSINATVTDKAENSNTTRTILFTPCQEDWVHSGWRENSTHKIYILEDYNNCGTDFAKPEAAEEKLAIVLESLTFAGIIFLLQFMGFLALIGAKLYNVMSASKAYSYKGVFLGFIGLILLYGVGFFTTMISYTDLLFVALFKLQTWVLVVGVMLSIIELFMLLGNATQGYVRSGRRSGERYYAADSRK